MKVININMYKKILIYMSVVFLFSISIFVNAEENTPTVPRPSAPKLNIETDIQKPNINIPTVNTAETKSLSKSPVGTAISEESKPDRVMPIISKTKNPVTQPVTPAVSANNKTNLSKRTNINLTQDVDFSAYMTDLQKSIKKNWNPPQSTVSKRIVVLFTIGKDGTLLSNKIFQSSGNVAADEAALQAVKDTAPFKPLPAEYKGNSVSIQFTFDYNVYASSQKQKNSTSSKKRQTNYNNIQTNNNKQTKVDAGKQKSDYDHNNIQTDIKDEDIEDEQRLDDGIILLQDIAIIAGIIIFLIVVCIIYFFKRKNSEKSGHDTDINVTQNDIKETLSYQTYEERTIDLLKTPSTIYIEQKNHYILYIIAILIIITLVLICLQIKGLI